MKNKVVTFGEIMLRLNPAGFLRFVQANHFEASYAGGEANVAVSLAGYGVDASFVSKVPTNEIGQSAVNSLRRYGVDTSMIVRGGPRLGIYFIEKGASQRASKVIYDRAGSSIALATAEEFDWEKILSNADWFHFTGITPALGGQCPQICFEAVRMAKQMNIVVSCDLNYRKKLWSKQEAKAGMSKLSPYIDLCIANEEDIADVFDIHPANTDIESGNLDKQAYSSVASQLASIYGFDKVAITLRESISASVNNWGAMLYHKGVSYFSQTYNVHIVDRIGGGDSFGGALIYALMNSYDCQAAVDFAAAASCLKHSIECDFNLVSVDEVHDLTDGNASGRVQR